ncbi:MAG: hypothetical protein AB2L12_12795 [Smithellaceae bacterium]|nr:hypothetical protein [Syntrophorhabdus sp.]
MVAKTLAFSLIFLLLFQIRCVFSAVFSADDFPGTWYLVELISGDGPSQEPGWCHGSVSWDNQGNASISITNHNGQVDSGTYAWQPVINAEGVLTDVSDPLRKYHGIMSDDKKLFVTTQNEQPKNQPKISVWIKRERNDFSSIDLEGTWHFKGLISGDAPNQVPGWYYHTFTFNSTGVGIGASQFTDSLGTPNCTPYPPTLTISPDGIITVPGQDFLWGVMNDKKDMIWAVATMYPCQNVGVHGYNLIVAKKERNDNSFKAIDFFGTWYGHELISGDGPTQEPGWGYRTIVVDKVSNGLYSGINHNEQSDCGQMPLGWTVNSTGSITDTANSFLLNVSGFMFDDKKMMVHTQTESMKNQPSLSIYIRRTHNEIWGDISGDGKIGLQEAIHALQVVSGNK